jgi:hypothetical protein
MFTFILFIFSYLTGETYPERKNCSYFKIHDTRRTLLCSYIKIHYTRRTLLYSYLKIHNTRRTKWALQDDRLYFNRKIYIYNETTDQVTPVADIV